MSYLTFDGLTPGATTPVTFGSGSGLISLAFSGTAQVASGSASGLYAAPYLSGKNAQEFGSQPDGSDATAYLSTGIGSIKFSFASGQTHFGLLWGSDDNYNSLSFYNSGGLIGTVSGTEVWIPPTGTPNGDQGVIGTFYVDINSTTPFTSVVASSTSYAFEFDNVAYGVPEGGSVTGAFGVVLAGFAAVGVRRR
jgi:hypothetical protein